MRDFHHDQAMSMGVDRPRKLMDASKLFNRLPDAFSKDVVIPIIDDNLPARFDPDSNLLEFCADVLVGISTILMGIQKKQINLLIQLELPAISLDKLDVLDRPGRGPVIDGWLVIDCDELSLHGLQGGGEDARGISHIGASLQDLRVLVDHDEIVQELLKESEVLGGLGDRVKG